MASDEEKEPAPRRRRTRGRVVEMADFAPLARKPRVVLTGGSGLLGSRLVRALAARGDREVVVFDLVPPADAPPGVRHRFLDLTLPHADGTLFRMLKEEKPEALVHLAQLRSPSRQATYAHELNAIGALHVFAAAGEAKISRIVLGSTTLVYGARGDNPNFLTEEHSLRPDAQDHFVRDFVEAESHARSHVKRLPDSKVAILRFAPLLSPDDRDYRAREFAAPVTVAMLGYDPLLQALQPDDGVQALLLTLDNPDAKGVFNISPEGVLPLSSVRLLFGSLAVPVVHGLAYALIEASWLAGLGVMPGVHAHYLRFLCVADNSKARRVLGWEPRYTTLETFLLTARVRRGSGRILDFDRLADEARLAAYYYDQRVKPPKGDGKKEEEGTKRTMLGSEEGENRTKSGEGAA
jgi:UDP-glucose 4-epimerase